MRACARKAREIVGQLSDLEARRRSEDRGGKLHGDADLREVPDGALEENPHEQRLRTPQPRDNEADQGRRQLPRRQGRHDAGGVEASSWPTVTGAPGGT